MVFKHLITGAAASAFMLSAGAAFAGDAILSGSTISAKTTSQMSNVTLTVTGPDGYYAKEYSARSAPFMSLQKNGVLKDGLYKWEMTGASNERVEANPMGLNNGRGETARKYVNKSVVKSGTFRVVGGVVAAPDSSAVEKEPSRRTQTFSFSDK